MSKKKEYETKTSELVVPMVDARGFELVDVEYVKEAGDYYLRVYIDKDKGITIDDLVDVNHELSDKLDELDFIEGSYILEVCSPGLDRPLKKAEDFTRNIGKKIEIHFYRAVNGEKIHEAVLKSFDEENITVSYENDETITYKRRDISAIRQAIDF